jgi:hypothetical protein
MNNERNEMKWNSIKYSIASPNMLSRVLRIQWKQFHLQNFSTAPLLRKRKSKTAQNTATALVLAAFVGLVYYKTITKISDTVCSHIY